MEETVVAALTQGQVGGEAARDADPEGVAASRELIAEAGRKLQEVFGYSAFREGQERAIGAILAGRDTLVVMPTGSGKSLCYQIPALVLPGVTVVVSPLIALMKDQVDALRLRGAPATFINSSIGAEEQWDRLAAVRDGSIKLVYVAPERFRVRSFRQAIAGANVSLLAVDEAHCISQWGHDFRPDYRRLKEIRALLPRVPAVALTATATPDVRDDILRELEMASPERVVTGFDRPNLAFEVSRVSGRAEKEAALLELLRDVEKGHDDEGVPAGIVYAGTRKRAEEIADALESSTSAGAATRRCRAYHAGLSPDERRQVQEDFMEGRLPWVVATVAFGMGVDKADIRFVVHYDLPGSIEAYYQEVGRAGRDGRPSRCRLLFAETDRRLQEFFIEGSNPRRDVVIGAYEFLFSLGENPVFRTIKELEERFRSWFADPSLNPLVFGSSLSILERAGLIERLDHYENLAEVAPSATPWPTNPYSERATVKGALFEALGRLFQSTDGEAAPISLERWSRDLDVGDDALRRALHELEKDGYIRYTPPFRGRAIRLPAARVPVVKWTVDFEALARRRDRDYERLEEVLRFAKARGCRRDAVLRYFGESPAPGGCGRCDRCRNGSATTAASEVPRELSPDELTVVRKLLSGVARARGRCGQGRVVAMLRGSKSRGMDNLGFTGLSTYGLLRDHGRRELNHLFELLGDDGCIDHSGDSRPVVTLTPRGVRVMKGEEKISLPLPLPCREVRPEPAKRIDPLQQEDMDYDVDLFEKLRKLRRIIADELSVPAYRVFNDRTLRAMARSRPQTPEDLLRIPGVGRVTLELFGERFLESLRES